MHHLLSAEVKCTTKDAATHMKTHKMFRFVHCQLFEVLSYASLFAKGSSNKEKEIMLKKSSFLFNLVRVE